MKNSFMKNSFVFLCALLCSSVKILAQGEIPVNMYTGQPSIGIPITTITSVDVSVPVALTYDVNSASNKGIFGYGWNLSAGGSVSREVRGLPDDFGYGDTRKGWFYNNGSGASIAEDIKFFTPTSDTLTTTVSDETVSPTDNDKLYSLGYLVDTEPDIFNFSFGDFSGSFVFDNHLVIRTMPYRDILIVPTYASGTDKKIISFTIKTNDGYVYTFADVGEGRKKTSKSQYVNGVYFLSTDYELYKDNYVTYNAEWNLTRIDSPNGAYVTFSYSSNFPSEFAGGHVKIGFYKQLDPIVVGSTDLEVRNIYGIDKTAPRRPVSEIIGSTGEKVSFLYVDEHLNRIDLHDLRKSGSTLVKSFMLSYDKVDYGSQTYGFVSYSKYFLSTITELSDCDRMPPIKFSYAGISKNFYPPITRHDAWGYESGHSDLPHSMPKLYIYPNEPEKERYRMRPIPNYSGQEIILNGVDRNATGLNRMGALASITFPHGSVTTFVFGSNQHLDTRTNENVTVGGLRIEQIQYFDGYNATPVTKTFEYVDASGKSTGRLLRKPVFAMPAFKWKNPYALNSTSAQDEKNYGSLTGDDVWKYLTMRVDTDIAPSERTRGNTVGYSMVTVKRPGAGKATFEYHTPAVYGQNTHYPWEATVHRIARPNQNPMATMGIISSGGPWRFPNAPNPDFDYERGLIWRKSDYNEAGKLIQRTETTYQYLYNSVTLAPVKVWGLSYDKFALCDDNFAARRIYLYGKYFLLTDVDKVPSVETVTTYDANDATNTKFTTTSTQYFYESTNHKLLTRVKTTLADGSIRSTRLKYPKDYANITSNAENAVLMLSNLQNNFRHGAPIETLNTLQKAGGTEQVIGGSIVKFDPFTFSKPLPESVWALRIGTPIPFADFDQSQVELSGGVYKLTIDSAYKKTASFTAYNTTGQLMSTYDVTARNQSSTFYAASTSLPVATLANASGAESAFSDFESISGLEFSNGAEYYGTGRSGAKAYYPLATLSRTVTKAAVENYILSLWVKSNATLNLTVYLKSTGGSTYATIPWSIPSTGGTEFKYVQKIIPMSSVTTSTFVVEIVGSGLSTPSSTGITPGLMPVMDDVFFFPEKAVMTSFDYQIPFGVSTVTSGTGEAGHTVYDNLGRTKYVKDRDGNIVKRNTYNYALSESPLVAEFTIPIVVTVDEPASFNATVIPCLDNVTYSWNTGSGFVTGTSSLTKTWNETGGYTVQLKVSHPQHGEKIYSRTVYVQPVPVTVTICAKGVSTYSGNTNTITESYSCAGITSTPPNFGTIFRAEPSIACGDGCSYKWFMKEFDGFTWVEVGIGQQYTFPKVVPETKSFLVMCKMTTEGGVVESLPMSVTINP